MTEKLCPSCNIVKPIEEFGKNKARRDGVACYCKPCNYEYLHKRRKKYRANRDDSKVKNWYRKDRYGVGNDWYNKQFARQSGCCAICGTHQSDLKRCLCIDHCHDTGQVRQLLCGKCNTGLGYFNHDPELLTIAMEYLQKHNNGDTA
jgi:hypothetical protein